VHILFLNIFIVLTSEQLLPEEELAEESIHDGFIPQQMLPEIFETLTTIDESLHIDLTNQPTAGRFH